MELICVTFYNVDIEFKGTGADPASHYSRQFSSISTTLDVSQDFNSAIINVLERLEQGDPELVADQFDDQIVSISYGGFALSDNFPRGK